MPRRLLAEPGGPRGRAEIRVRWAGLVAGPLAGLAAYLLLGLSLAGAIQANGVDRVIGSMFTVLAGVHPFLIVLAIALVVIFLTELTSNTR